MVLDFQTGGLIIGYSIKFLKLVFYSLKNVIVTGSAKSLSVNSHTVEDMTKVPQGFDFSFLNEEEARKILQVLERNEELQRAEKDRIRYRANSFFPWVWATVGGVRGVPRARREWRKGSSFCGAPVRGSGTLSVRPERAARQGEICSESLLRTLGGAAGADTAFRAGWTASSGPAA